ELVGLINRFGPLAVGLTGEDADSITAVRHVPWLDGEPVDIGRVGDITGVDTGALDGPPADGRIPVVSPLARSAEDGLVHNGNAAVRGPAARWRGHPAAHGRRTGQAPAGAERRHG